MTILTLPGGRRVPFIWTQLVRPVNDQHGPMCQCIKCEWAGWAK